jgi:hypothetical protein
MYIEKEKHYFPTQEYLLEGEEKNLDNVEEVINDLYKEWNISLIKCEENNGGGIIIQRLKKC